MSPQITDIEFDHTTAETPAFADRCGCPKCERYRGTPPAAIVEAVAPAYTASVAASLIPVTPIAVVPAMNAAAHTAIDTAARAAAERATTRRAVNVGGGIVGDMAERAATERQAIPRLPARVDVATHSVPASRPVAPVAPHTIAGRPNAASMCHCPTGTRTVAPIGAVCPDCNLPRRGRSPLPPQTATVPSDTAAAADRALGISTSLRAPTGADAIVTPREQVLRDVQARLDAGRAPTRQDLQKWSTLLRSTTIETTGAGQGIVSHKELIAGARSTASGIFLGFAGAGNLERSQLAQVLAAASLPADWLPTAKSAHAQAGRIVGDLSGDGYVVRAARVPTGTKAKPAAERGWKARWSVGAGNMTANVGEAFGRTVLTVTLTATDALVIEGEEHLAARVRADFDTACRSDLYPVSDVSNWLKVTLQNRFRAARVGGNWYVRRKYAADAERLCSEMAKLWGTAWLLPAIPMATCDELCRGLVDNFAREADAVLATYRAELAEAKTHGESEIGTRRATTLLGEVRTLTERAVGYTAMFGERLTMELREKLCAAADEIAESVDDISQRFSLIFDELLRDAKRDGWESI